MSTATNEDGNLGPSAGKIRMSNPSVLIRPHDIDVHPNFVSHDEATQILHDVGLTGCTDGLGREKYNNNTPLLQGQDFVWEGFEQRKRVRRFRVKSDDSDHKNHNEDGASPLSERTTTTTPLPPSLENLWNRIQKLTPSSETAITTTGHSKSKETEISIEVYPENQLIHLGRSSRTQVMTFETSGSYTNYDDANHSDNFVAVLPLTVSLIENVNRPKIRQVNCWELFPPEEQHSTSIVLPEHTLIIKRHEYLYEWRSRIASVATPERTAEWTDNEIKNDDTVVSSNSLDSNSSRNSVNNNNNTDLIVLIKICHLPKELLPSKSSSSSSSLSSTTGNNSTTNDTNGTTATATDFGYVRTIEHEELDLQRQSMDEIPSLDEMLTIIVTTSPIRSNPSTELLERVFDTFLFCGEEFAYKCRKVIICDGCRQRDESTTKRHTNDKQSMRNGIVNNEQSNNYVEFKSNLRRLCQDALPDSPFSRAEVEELEERQGYGFALRHALRHCNICTPYVIVIQHDRTFMRPTPIKDVVRTMWRHSNIKYVGMSMRSNLLYRDIFISQYGKVYMDDMAECTLRPSELALDSNLFGPDSESTRQMDYGDNPNLRRQNMMTLAETYRGSQQYLDHVAWMEANKNRENSSSTATCQLSLTPTFFWYDNVHICETDHYRDFVYNPKYKMVVRGGFVEDKLSPVIKKTVERLGSLKDGHGRFGCYLLDDHSGLFFTGHLDGGSYLTKEGKEKLLAQTKRKGGRKRNEMKK
jgi:hypothetical protein